MFTNARRPIPSSSPSRLAVAPRSGVEALEGRLLFAADPFEVDNTAAQAKVITSGVTQVHSLHTDADVDWVKFTLAVESNVTIATNGPSELGDTEIRLFAANATTQLAYDDDDGNRLYSKITPADVAGTALNPGTYYVKVNGFEGDDPLDRYFLDVTAVAIPKPDAFESDNAPATAKAIVPNAAAQSRSIHVDGDVDWAKFTLAKASNVTIETNGPGGDDYDTELRLYKADTTTAIAYDDDDGNLLYSKIGLTDLPSGLPAGTYYIQVNNYRQDPKVIPAYTLKLTAVTLPVADAMESDNTAATAKTIATNGTAQQHTFSTTGDVDWVKFTLTAARKVTVETAGAAGGDTQIRLYRASNTGTSMAFDDNDGMGNYSKLTPADTGTLAAGTYFVKVTNLLANPLVGGYTLKVTAV
jgi:hypothetical protein